MIPIRFGEPQRQLFGLFHPPSGIAARPQNIVLCNPFGQEAIRCNRLLRVLGDHLSRRGHAVLRFDYFGTGDSDGDDDQGDLEAWVDDVLRADEEVVRLSGQRASSWFGLRLGATIAALASARTTSARRRLALWDPVIDGPSYLRELYGAHAAVLSAVRAPTKPAQGHREHEGQTPAEGTEALGFPITGVLRQQIGELSPALWSACQADLVSLIGNDDSAEISFIANLLAEGGKRFELRRIDTRSVWASCEAMNTAIVPSDALQSIVAALSEEP